MLKNLTILFLVTAFFFGLSSRTFAQVYESALAPTQTSSVISLNKQVQKPGTNSYVENLSANDPKFQPGSTVPFRIIVKNTGNATLSNIQITDTFPQFMTNQQNAQTSSTFTINSLRPGESQTITVNGRVGDTNSLPADQRIFCLVNQATAQTGDQVSSDNTQLCVENASVSERAAVNTNGTNGGNNGSTKGGLPLYTAPQNLQASPKTGPELIVLIGLVPTGLLGHFLRKRTNRH